MSIYQDSTAFANFVRERESIRILKVGGVTPPWTQDEILQRYKFCNISREHDTVTIALRKHWYAGYEEHPNLWLAAAMARLFNWPATLQAVGFPDVWGQGYIQHVIDVVMARHARKEQVYNSAYRLPAPSDGTTMVEHLMRRILLVASHNRVAWEHAQEKGTLQAAVGYFTTLPYIGNFLAYQIVLDLAAYAPLDQATDRTTWTVVGPGSTRGLNRVTGRLLTAKVPEVQSVTEMRELTAWMQGNHFPDISLIDIEHALCEFDKYERVRTGEGRPKHRYYAT
jgi:hypothetical protein